MPNSIRFFSSAALPLILFFNTSASASPEFSLQGEVGQRSDFSSKNYSGFFDFALQAEEQFDDLLLAALRFRTGASLAPYSGLQDFGNDFSKKPVWLDRAFVATRGETWPISSRVGKSELRLYHMEGSQLLWDEDLSPEGISFDIPATFNSGKVSLDAAAYWLEHRPDAKDTLLLGATASGKFEFLDSRFRPGLGFISIGNAPAHYGLLVGSLWFQNEVWDGFPLTLCFDFGQNTELDRDHRAWLVGIEIGRLRLPREFKMKYSFRRLESQVTLPGFTDSDFGKGGTNTMGHTVGGSFKISKATDLAWDLHIAANRIGAPIEDVLSELKVQFGF